MQRKILFSFLISIYSISLFSQQDVYTSYLPIIHQPAYKKGNGPVVFVDAGHNNFHTKEGRYKAFSNLLERDGYRVRSYRGAFKKKTLLGGNILVISNALNAININYWVLPNPSAFTKTEIEVVRKWVASGGRLFLIADHMPMGGAAQDLSAAFGFQFTNGFVFDTTRQGTFVFTKDEGSLVDGVITQGRNKNEVVSRVATFTGQAFQIPDDANPLLVLGSRHVNFLPDTAWVFNATTPRINMEGWCQVAYTKYGKGRVVVSGEAAMFAAQRVGPQRFKIGMNSPEAPENYQFLLNLIHWLDGIIEPE